MVTIALKDKMISQHYYGVWLMYEYLVLFIKRQWSNCKVLDLNICMIATSKMACQNTMEDLGKEELNLLILCGL